MVDRLLLVDQCHLLFEPLEGFLASRLHLVDLAIPFSPEKLSEESRKLAEQKRLLHDFIAQPSKARGLPAVASVRLGSVPPRQLGRNPVDLLRALSPPLAQNELTRLAQTLDAKEEMVEDVLELGTLFLETREVLARPGHSPKVATENAQIGDFLLEQRERELELDLPGEAHCVRFWHLLREKIDLILSRW